MFTSSRKSETTVGTDIFNSVRREMGASSMRSVMAAKLLLPMISSMVVRTIVAVSVPKYTQI